MTAPRDPQLMDPIDDPEEFIAASIWHSPLIFPTRTEVLEHTLLHNGNGYGWSPDGKVRSVFAHIDPSGDEDTIARYERDAAREEARERKYDPPLPPEYSMARWYREQAAELRVIRSEYLQRARTYGPVRLTEQVPGSRERQARMITSRDLGWTLLGRAPQHVHPAWQPYLAEARDLFAPLFVEQGTLWEGSL